MSRPGRLPPWWPDGEPWPPRVGPPWRRGTGFRYRFGALLLPAVFLTVFGGSVVLRTVFGFETAGRGAGWPLFVGLSLTVFVLTMRRVGRPLGEIVSAAERVASGDFATRVKEHGPPWLRSVAAAFNRMTSTLQRQQRQRRDLMADISHELRTPLTVMQGRLEGMLDGVYPRDERHVAQVLDQARLLARLVEDLRTLAHSEGGSLTLQKEATDIALLVDDTVHAQRAAADLRQITITAQLPSTLPTLDVDPLRLREVMINLLSNAVRHSRDGGEVVVAGASSADSIQLRVTDHGAGITPDELPHIFDRFYKGAASTGSGLGLAIARHLVTAHGGTLTVESQVGTGTTMIVALPRSG